MAKKKLTGAALAESRVRSQGADAANVYSLPVNPDFQEPNVVDKTRGVEYPGAAENVQAEQGIARRVLDVLMPKNVSEWIGTMARRRGGNEGLARDLVAMKHDPNAKSEYKNMLRALQRAGPSTARSESHVGISKKLYRERIALLRIREAKHLVIGVRGLWHIEDEEKYRVFNSDPRERSHVEAAIDALRLDGAGFISAVIDIAAEYVQPYAPELLKTHELRVEVSG